MDSNYVVAQGNNLIEARHNKPLTAREQKIILTMVSAIQPSDNDFKEYRILLKDFSEMLGLKGSIKYGEIKEIVKNLMEKTVEIPRPNGGWLLAHWVSTAEYIDGAGVIELTFSPKLKPYLLQLKNQFTSYRLSNILSLNSTYSIRLYELMKKWQHLGKWECPVEDLRGKLGVGEGKYALYGHFKARVLRTAIDEVNEKTDLDIGFEEIKKGRGVVRIAFTIKHTAENELKLPIPPEKRSKPTENEDIKVRLNALAVGYQFDSSYFAQMHQGASLIWGDQAENELKLLIQYVNDQESIKNPLGFIKSKLLAAWEEHSQGIPVTFATLQPSVKCSNGREEIIPDWFKKSTESGENEVDLKVDEERKQLLKEMGIES
ncbi:replication initiation protein [Sporosarcina sp. NPDC096371]|uniref:replication initiation protein n=1 Tax=Sporosarcina sp. NPDC096371 TaxID=3364530 RepID=UPI0038084632